MTDNGPGPGARPRVATYRVQLHAGFGFDDAAAIAGYLARLGVSHLYCSPYLQAAAGSTHGYDVVDHSRISSSSAGSPGTPGWPGLAEAGLGEVLDIVPNHMAVGGRANAWWWDVLEHGVESRYAGIISTSTGIRRSPSWPASCSCRCSVTTTAGCWRPANCRRARDGSFSVRYHDYEAPLSHRTLTSWTATTKARSRRP